MQIRPPSLPDGEPAAGQLPDADPEVVEWHVPRRATLLKFAIAAGLAALALLVAPQRAQVIIGLVAAVAVAGFAARDLIAPVRLRLDRDGLVAVRGYARRRRFPWPVIESVRVDSRPRLGIRVETVEIDAGDDILIFGAYDLGVPAGDAARTVDLFRARAAGESGSR